MTACSAIWVSTEAKSKTGYARSEQMSERRMHRFSRIVPLNRDLPTINSRLIVSEGRPHTASGEPRGQRAGLPYPQISIHRGRLQRLLYNAFQAHAQGGVHVDRTFMSWHETDARDQRLLTASRSSPGSETNRTGDCGGSLAPCLKFCLCGIGHALRYVRASRIVK